MSQSAGPTWPRAIVVGASSGIGAALARELVREGSRVALVARREDALATLARDLNGEDAERPARAVPFAHDATHFAEVPALWARIAAELGGVDLVVYSAGVMPPVGEDEYRFEVDREILEVNVLGAVAWLNEAAKAFTRAGAGTIVGIGSVAGDRGRRGNPVYCASKAALDTYLEALRHRLTRRGVAVVTVKPGPVDTPMSAKVARRPFLISADVAARRILRAARRHTAVAYVPPLWRPIMLAVRNIPHALYARLDL